MVRETLTGKHPVTPLVPHRYRKLAFAELTAVEGPFGQSGLFVRRSKAKFCAPQTL